MLDVTLLILRFVFLALLYLFIFAIARMIYRDMARARDQKEVRPTAKAASQPRLIVLEAPRVEPGKSYPLAKMTAIGRSPQTDIFLDDSYVSTSHARIVRKNGEVLLEDAGSTNGTYLNGKRVTEPVALRRGNKIKIGRTVLEFLD